MMIIEKGGFSLLNLAYNNHGPGYFEVSQDTNRIKNEPWPPKLENG